MNKNPLISVGIPAYNKPVLTQKAISSVLSQSYRPIEIVLVDDHSPNSLEIMCDKFQHLFSSEFQIKYFLNERNLRPYLNMKKVYSLCTGKYFMFLPHDDYLIHDDFFRDSIKLFESNPEIMVAITNSVLENPVSLMMSIWFDQWLIIDGYEYVQNSLWNGCHPSYSGVLLSKEKLDQIEYLSYFVSEETFKQLDIEPDESFLSIILLASLGKIAISGRVTSVRGTPPDSYSSSKFWHDKGHEGVFFQLMYFIKKSSDSRINGIIEKILFKYLSFNRINWQMIDFFNDRNVRNLILLGFLKKLILSSTPRSLLRKLANNIQNSILKP